MRRPPSRPLRGTPIKPGPFDPRDLPALAREAHVISGLTQGEAAHQLNTTQQAYSQALGVRRGLNRLRSRIVEAFTPFRVVGPFLELIEKEASGGKGS